MQENHNEIIKEIIKEKLREPITDIERMKIGIMNEVYVVTTPSRKVVFRMNKNKSAMLGVEKNIKLFNSLGINVPTVIASDYSHNNYPFNYQILSYIDGKDLGAVIGSLSDSELRSIANEVVSIFKKFEAMPTNGKFGWVEGDDNELVDSWAEIIKGDKIEERNNKTGVVGDDLVKREKELYQRYIPYFSTVKATLYYDDITSKNILIKDGKFSGLVDMDCLIQGDPLETVGAIKASWYGTHYGEVYTRAIEDGLGLSVEQRKIVTVYALFNRILWLSEIGIKFNENTSEVIDWGEVEKSKETINNMFKELESGL